MTDDVRLTHRRTRRDVLAGALIVVAGGGAWWLVYQRYRQKGLQILAISIDSQKPAVVERFVKEFKLTFPVGLDPRWDVAEKYTVRALPSSFLIDRKGSVAAIAVGPRDWDGPAAHAVIESLLKEQ